MPPRDIKSRSPALSVFVNTLSKKKHFQPIAGIKAKRALRESSAFAPWESSALAPWECTKATNNAAAKKSAFSFKHGLFNNSKRTDKKENDKFISFSFKSKNTGKDYHRKDQFACK